MAADYKVRRIAKAALNVATELGVVDDFLDRFELLDRTFRDNKSFRHLMITHRIPLEQKMKVLRRAFGGTLSELEYEILQIMMVQNLGIKLPAVARSLIMLARARDVRMELTIFTPESVTGKDLNALGQRIEANVGRPLRIMGIADPDLLGGVKLRLGNTLVDGSLARRLEMLRQELV